MTEELSYSFSQVSALSVTERSGCTSVSVCECVGESRFTSTEKLGCKTSRADRGGKKRKICKLHRNRRLKYMTVNNERVEGG